jgi:hypothetical protein
VCQVWGLGFGGQTIGEFRICGIGYKIIGKGAYVMGVELRQWSVGCRV